MDAERPQTAVIRSPGRSFTHDDVTWVVREAEGRGVPGAKGASSLIFDSREVIRRIWVFPRNWDQLNAHELWVVSERSVVISSKFDVQARDLACTLCFSLAAIQRSQALLARAEIAAAHNRAERAECRRLAAACRAERDYMRELVESHATDLRAAGLTAEDASLYVASVVRESMAGLGATNDSATRMESDASRWCAMAYQAA
ncbi:MAG TPA: hypothetical protein VFP26_14490 [Gemmatimonadaceae bacterium]|nr:hypothetical protein [Gemmatimonadaceae bacterium]